MRSARCPAEMGMHRIRYVAYGSNVATAPFRCYLSGGRPVGGPRRSEVLTLTAATELAEIGRGVSKVLDVRPPPWWVDW